MGSQVPRGVVEEKARVCVTLNKELISPNMQQRAHCVTFLRSHCRPIACLALGICPNFSMVLRRAIFKSEVIAF